jgi:TM2 domain-containing membrane protein YozV
MINKFLQCRFVFSSIGIFYQLLILLLAQNLSYGQNSDLFSPNNRLIFGNYLFEEQDYLRAIDEYRSYLVVYPNDTLNFKIGFAQSQMGNFSDSKNYFEELISKSIFIDESEFELLKINYLQENFSDLRSKNYSSSKFRSEILKLQHYSYLSDEIDLPDSNLLFSIYNDEELLYIRTFYNRKLNPGYKSETFAAILSAVIPGAGKIYAGETGDGITALILTGLFGFLAYDNFQADHKTRAWIFTGLTAFFYAGNIYGSAAAAQIYNAGIKLNLENEIQVFINQKKYFTPRYEILN